MLAAVELIEIVTRVYYGHHTKFECRISNRCSEIIFHQKSLINPIINKRMLDIVLLNKDSQLTKIERNQLGSMINPFGCTLVSKFRYYYQSIKSKIDILKFYLEFECSIIVTEIKMKMVV